MTDQTVSRLLDRRRLVWMLGGAILGATAGAAGPARAAGRIAPLIDAARALDPVSVRIDFISRSLLGTRYGANTLIGGPNRREEFVVRDDAFDCVTFCETVLAAARARDYPGFEAALRMIRYANDVVTWEERNHYFADWCRRVIDKKICRSIEWPDAVTINKSVNFGNLGRRQFAIQSISTASLLAQPGRLVTGDIAGFVSRRPSLDFFHTGLVIASPQGEPVLRHASQSRRRVVDEPLARFVAVNRVLHVALLRPVEQALR